MTQAVTILAQFVPLTVSTEGEQFSVRCVLTM
jgi:hypothetical protein